MTSISRRKTLKYIAAVPIVSALGLSSCESRKKDQPLASHAASPATWNVLLHGLYVVQWTSPADQNAMRLIFPIVSSPCHTHEYWIGDFAPKQQNGYTLGFKTTSVMNAPDPASNIVLPASGLKIPDESSGIKGVAQCWLDLPRPSAIQPLRPRNLASCQISFLGTLGQQVKATILPAVTLLTYSLDANPGLQTNIPNPPSLTKNLVIRSEPRHHPTDNGHEAFQSLLRCMGVDDTQFLSQGDCCPPPPSPSDPGTYGVSQQDESTLEEVAGEVCNISPPTAATCPKKGLQIRACMTVMAT